MEIGTIIALPLEVASTTLANLAYLREHDAAAELPCLSMRRPLQSLRLLLSHRGWLLGFAMEGGSFAFYTAALALASLALVQSIGAGGIGILAYVSARRSGRRLGARRMLGVAMSIVGLLALSASLAKASGSGGGGSIGVVLLWIGGTAALAVLALWIARRAGALAAGQGLAGGLLFSIGDFSTKLATQGGPRVAFLATLVLGYTLGTSLLQLGYQRGGALTVAGLATLCTNAMPIAAGTVVLHEPVPGGLFGALRILAFAAVTVGAVLLASPEQAPATLAAEQTAGVYRHDRPAGGPSRSHTGA